MLLGAPVPKVTEERDLEVATDEQLKFQKQVPVAISRANQILRVIRHSFKLLDAHTNVSGNTDYVMAQSGHRMCMWVCGRLM